MSDFEEIKYILKDQSKTLFDQSKKLDEIHFSIYGNKEAGIKGIASIVKSHDKYINNDKKIKLIGAGVAMTGGAGIWEAIKHFFKF